MAAFSAVQPIREFTPPARPGNYKKGFPMHCRVALILWLMLLAPSLAPAQDMSLSGVLIDGQGWQLISEGYKFTEGPAADAEGQVYFTDIPNNRIHKIGLDDKVGVFAEATANTN